MSAFGSWSSNPRLPEFRVPASRFTASESASDADPTSAPRFHLIGNRAVQMLAGSDGTVGLFDESSTMRWLVHSDGEGGTGTSVITEADGTTWGSERTGWRSVEDTALIFGPTWFAVESSFDGMRLVRRMVCPEGDEPWVFVEVVLHLDRDAAARNVTHTEGWRLRPRFLETFGRSDDAAAVADFVTYSVGSRATALAAEERFDAAPGAHGPPRTLTLETFSAHLSEGVSVIDHRMESQRGSNPAHPLLRIHTKIAMVPGSEIRLFARFGRIDPVGESGPVGALPVEPVNVFEHIRGRLLARLPSASVARFPALSHEIAWHGAVLSGGASRDDVLGGHTLNQGCTYAFTGGANVAARDALQHAIPLVYIEPDLALSVLRNTCAWARPDGNLPFGLTARKQRLDSLLRPSDQNLWAMWLAAEYAAATGDLAAFAVPVGFHPGYDVPPVTLAQHLITQLRFLIDGVGTGAGGHLRILNADWNDMALNDIDVERQLMIDEGGSVLNSAMAAWVLPVFAPLLDSLGEHGHASEARSLAASLRKRVSDAWNGRWFHRAYTPDGRPVGEDRCWLEVQPWAILCGAADPSQARSLLDTIDTQHRAGSPLGARLIWPLADHPDAGMGTRGGVWYSINMTLIWAAATVDPDLAWDEWSRMSLHNHSGVYPALWEGTLSGPDSWNSPETVRPGATWSYPWLSMQRFPVANPHAHAQPLLSYLRLLGVAPTDTGALNIGSGNFRSRVLELDDDGHGGLRSTGPVRLLTRHGPVNGEGGLRF